MAGAGSLRLAGVVLDAGDHGVFGAGDGVGFRSGCLRLSLNGGGEEDCGGDGCGEACGDAQGYCSGRLGFEAADDRIACVARC